MMYRSLLDDSWHADDRCPRLRTPFAHVHMDLSTLPGHKRPCPACSSWLSAPLGKCVAVYASALLVGTQPLDWPGLAARRRFMLDPLAAFTVRLAGSSRFFFGLRESLAPVLDAMRDAGRDAARTLDPAPLYDCISASGSQRALEYLTHLRPTSAAILAPVVRRTPYDPSVPMAAVLVSSQNLPRFCEGSIVQRVVDLFHLRDPLTPTSTVVPVPRCLRPALSADHLTGSVEVSGLDRSDVLVMTDRLFAAAPGRGLPAALAAAQLLTRSAARRVP